MFMIIPRLYNMPDIETEDWDWNAVAIQTFASLGVATLLSAYLPQSGGILRILKGGGVNWGSI